MSVEHLAIVLHHSRAKGTDKLVLLGIANHSGDGGSWPAVATLARYANVAPRSVQRSLDGLVRLGELRRDLQAGGTLSSHRHTWERPNRYEVLVTCPADCDRTPQHRRYPQAPAPSSTAVDSPDSPASDRVTPTSPPDTGVVPPGDADVTRTVPVNPADDDLPAPPEQRTHGERTAEQIRRELRRQMPPRPRKSPE